MAAYYNEFDPFAAEWLRNLISAGHIAPGDVDDRSITEVSADDLEGYEQCHFFAGIGLWSLALRWAGWPDNRSVWTGSCPCQPLSSAGQRKGHADQRHLWPAFHSLIAERRPATVLGEQVASKDGREWFSAVRADLEGLGYACGAADLCAASVGAPHIRQRLFWVANSDGAGRRQAGHGERRSNRGAPRKGEAHWPSDGGAGNGMGDSIGDRLEGGSVQDLRGTRRGQEGAEARCSGLSPGGLADADGGQPRQAGPIQPGGKHGLQPEGGGVERMANAECNGQHRSGEARPRRWGESSNRGFGSRPRPPHGFWRDADWLHCRDGKWRPVEPGTFPLVARYPARVGVLRAYGNAICPEVAAEFVSAFMETQP